MPSFRSLILAHGYRFLFWYVLAVQAGLPVPSDPVLVIMGSVVGIGLYSFPLALVTAVLGAVTGDWLWYELGRSKGRSVLAWLCRFSLEPDTCVRKTEVGFMRRGAWSFLFVKFVPGMSLISTPLAGAMKMPRWQFLLADAAGATIWASCYLTLGVIFRRQIEMLLLKLGLFGQRAGIVIAVLLSCFILYRLWGRWRFRRQLRIDRVTPQEALALMNADPPAMIVDLRAPSAIVESKQKIAGAVVLRPAELRAHFQDLPNDREVLLYCT